MARIRANLNSFSTGFVSQKVRGNVDFEGYNNGLSECTNFLVQHTGGVFKRGGTEFISNTLNNQKVKIIPFQVSASEGYVCEFGDLESPQEENNYYIRFYTKDGLFKELYHNFFSLEEFETASVFYKGDVATIFLGGKIYTLTLSTDGGDINFTLSGDTSFTYPPLTPTNYDLDKKIKLAETGEKYKISFSNPDFKGFYPSDSNQVFTISGIINSDERDIVTISLRLGEITEDANSVEASWDDDFNTIEKPTISTEKEFLEWSISQFTEKRLELADITSVSVAMYEGRLFILAKNIIWGSSLKRSDLLDFSIGTNDDDGLMFSINEMSSDDILWSVGKSKLFLATASGLFMSGAATSNDSVVTPSNFRPRLFQKLGSSELLPITAGDAIFFVDNSGRNVHEIVLSAETGMYQANDLSLIGEDLTHSKIISHTWQQHPIKTYWCAVEDGYLCSLTYLKNNGIMAWAKHEIAGKDVYVEDVITIGSEHKEYLWLIVRRQRTREDGTQEITRSIEYMHNIYDPLSQEEFKQFFVDSGKSKEKKHTIENIVLGNHYSVSLSEDIRSTQESGVKMMFAPSGQISGASRNPFVDFHTNGYWKAVYATNFSNSGKNFDVLSVFDVIRSDDTYEQYSNKAITSGKIDPNIYSNDWSYSGDITSVDIFVKVADITRVDNSAGFTKIYCDTTSLSTNDEIVLRNTSLYRENGTICLDLSLPHQERYKVLQREVNSFNLGMDGVINIDTSGSECSRYGEIYKKKTTLTGSFQDSFTMGKNCEITVEGEVSSSCLNVYLNKISGTTELNNTKYGVNTAIQGEDTTVVTLYDYATSPDEKTVFVPVDAKNYGIYDADKADNGNLYEYFSEMEGLEHLANETVAVLTDGGTKLEQTVSELRSGVFGFALDQPAMYCVAGMPMKSVLKTVPFSGGNVLGSSVGVVGQQIHAVFSLYYSLGGKYGTDENKTYNFSYNVVARPFDSPKNLFTGVKKLPLINAQSLYDRCIYIEHDEPYSFNLLSITEELSVTDA